MKHYCPIAIIVSLAFFPSCKKEGVGGHAHIAAFPKHHEKPIKHVHIGDLNRGDYFLFATGFDSTVAKVVTGGAQVTIKRSQRYDEISVTIPLSED